MQEDQKDMIEVKAAAKRELGHIAGVQGFGVGDNALRVYLRDEGVMESLPADFQGVPIEPVVVGSIKAAGAEE
ncbi:MAG TPA: hypothetical protein VFQ39_10010 [Longimicrobium sp.]|nr:hypothetical protein [Longimicrobium sp.]